MKTLRVGVRVWILSGSAHYGQLSDFVALAETWLIRFASHERSSLENVECNCFVCACTWSAPGLLGEALGIYLPSTCTCTCRNLQCTVKMSGISYDQEVQDVVIY